MIFYTKKRRYRNIKLTNKEGKDICKFEKISKTSGKLETKDPKLIKLLKDKNKYPFIYWDEEKK
jgi:hypothetical protein